MSTGFIARDQLGLGCHTPSYGNLPEATIGCPFRHEAREGDCRLWIPRAFYIGIVGRPALTKVHMLYAMRSSPSSTFLGSANIWQR